ncbi:hypothetical protein VTK56DRAFT_7202 [Thermocarpiscus australiensis]
MDLTLVFSALVALFFLAVAADTKASYESCLDVMSELITGPQSAHDWILLALLALASGNLLLGLSCSLRSRLPAAALWAKTVIKSSAADAARRANLAYESVVGAAWGFINALMSVTIGDLLAVVSWLLRLVGRLVAAFLLLALRPILPVILRRYNLWKNWLEARAGDFVDCK